MTETVPVDPGERAGYPARCPACYYLLEGLPAPGRCPECGAGFDERSRFDCVRTHSLRRVAVSWLWPLVLGAALLPVPFMAKDGLMMSIALIITTTAWTVNSVFQMYAALRRERLRHVTLTNYAVTLSHVTSAIVLAFLVTVAAAGAVLLSVWFAAIVWWATSVT